MFLAMRSTWNSERNLKLHSKFFVIIECEGFYFVPDCSPVHYRSQFNEILDRFSWVNMMMMKRSLKFRMKFNFFWKSPFRTSTMWITKLWDTFKPHLWLSLKHCSPEILLSWSVIIVTHFSWLFPNNIIFIVIRVRDSRFVELYRLDAKKSRGLDFHFCW